MPSDDNNFFEDLSATVQDELQKEKTKKTKTNTQVIICQLRLSFVL